MESPITGSLLTALVVLTLTLGFWGLWALRIGSIMRVPQEPGPRAFLTGGFLVAGVFLLATDSTAVRVIVAVILEGAALTFWGVKWLQEGKCLAWFSSALGRLLVLGALSLALMIGLLALLQAAFPAAWSAQQVPANCCEYCEARHLCRTLVNAENWEWWRRGAEDNLQRSNAWSNLVFAVGGILAVSARPKEPLAWAFFVTTGLLTCGSFLFHATLTGETLKSMDVAGIYGALLALVVYGIERAMAAAGYFWRLSLRIVMAILVIIAAFVFVLTKRAMDSVELGVEHTMGIFGVALFVVSIIHVHRTFEQWDEKKTIDSAAAHEAGTMILPLLMLATAVVLRTQDAYLTGIQTHDLVNNTSTCPVPTDYGGPGLAMVTLIYMLADLALAVLFVNLWVRHRGHSGTDWIAACVIPFFAVLLFVGPAMLLLANHSSCSEQGWYNGHTWWHILSGAALYLQWRFYDHHTPHNSGDPVL